MNPDPCPSATPFTVVIVDDHFVVRDGLTAALEMEPDIQVVGAAESAAAARELYFSRRPNVVLLDLQLPDTEGCALITELSAADPPARILVFSAYSRDEDLKAVMDAGASGYITKTAPRDELLTALRRVATGGSYLDADSSRRVKNLRSGPTITPRERDVLALIARGSSNKEIAGALGISAETVKQHISTVLEKLTVKDRAQAAAEAIRRGIITLRE